MSSEASLVEVTQDGRAGVRHRLTRIVTSIGSDPESDVRIGGKGVEPVHAQIRIEGSHFVIEAVGDGRVVVNGRRADRRTLAPDDLIDLGAVRLRFSIGVPEPTAGKSGDGRRGATMASVRALVDFSEALMQNYDIEALMEVMLDGVVAVTQADRGFVMLVEGN